MHFEFIRGGQTSPRKTANLSSPPGDRLVPMRDLATLFGCTEPDIVKWSEHMSMARESLDWRGSHLSSLTLHDAFRLHLAMRAVAKDGGEGVDSRVHELRQALKLKEQALLQSRAELQVLESRVQQRDRELETLMKGVGELERTVEERAGIRQEMAGVQKLYVESQAQQSELIIKCSAAKKANEEMRADRVVVEQRLQELERQTVASETAKLLAEQAVVDSQSHAHNIQTGLTEDLERADQRLADAEAALVDAQPDPKEVEHKQYARKRTSQKLRILRSTCETATAVERNLERYCNRLESELRGQE